MNAPRRVLHLVLSTETPEALRVLREGVTVCHLAGKQDEEDYDRLLQAILEHDLVVPW